MHAPENLQLISKCVVGGRLRHLLLTEIVGSGYGISSRLAATLYERRGCILAPCCLAKGCCTCSYGGPLLGKDTYDGNHEPIAQVVGTCVCLASDDIHFLLRNFKCTLSCSNYSGRGYQVNWSFKFLLEQRRVGSKSLGEEKWQLSCFRSAC